MFTFSRGALLLSLCALLPTQLLAKDIITNTPVTYMMAAQLMQGTPVTTTYLAPKRYGIERLPNWYGGKGEQKVLQAGKDATVAITLKALWAEDPLFIHARQGNIKLIEIDAAQSISPRARGVATVKMNNGSNSLYAWLNPNNLNTMLSIVSTDLKRVWPQHTQQINSNLQGLLMDTRKLINEQQQRLFNKEIDTVLLMSDQLEDFASANQLFVLERFSKPALEWDEKDKLALKALVAASPEVWILSSKKVSPQLKALLPNFNQFLVVDSIDRWGKTGIDPQNPLQRWLF